MKKFLKSRVKAKANTNTGNNGSTVYFPNLMNRRKPTLPVDVNYPCDYALLQLCVDYWDANGDGQTRMPSLVQDCLQMISALDYDDDGLMPHSLTQEHQSVLKMIVNNTERQLQSLAEDERNPVLVQIIKVLKNSKLMYVPPSEEDIERDMTAYLQQCLDEVKILAIGDTSKKIMVAAITALQYINEHIDGSIKNTFNAGDKLYSNGFYIFRGRIIDLGDSDKFLDLGLYKDSGTWDKGIRASVYGLIEQFYHWSSCARRHNKLGQLYDRAANAGCLVGTVRPMYDWATFELAELDEKETQSNAASASLAASDKDNMVEQTTLNALCSQGKGEAVAYYQFKQQALPTLGEMIQYMGMRFFTGDKQYQDGDKVLSLHDVFELLKEIDATAVGAAVADEQYQDAVGIAKEILRYEFLPVELCHHSLTEIFADEDIATERKSLFALMLLTGGVNDFMRLADGINIIQLLLQQLPDLEHGQRILDTLPELSRDERTGYLCRKVLAPMVNAIQAQADADWAKAQLQAFFQRFDMREFAEHLQRQIDQMEAEPHRQDAASILQFGQLYARLTQKTPHMSVVAELKEGSVLNQARMRKN